MSQNELNFLSGVDFSTPGTKSRLANGLEKKDGYIVMANPGQSRKGDRHDISIAQFCIRSMATPKHVAIGVMGKDVLFVMDSELPEHQAINLYVQPSTKIIASKPKVSQLFQVLGVEIPHGSDSYTVIPFNLVHAFGNIYKAEFDEPKIITFSGTPIKSASASLPGEKHF